jgi:hypothetical protein
LFAAFFFQYAMLKQEDGAAAGVGMAAVSIMVDGAEAIGTTALMARVSVGGGSSAQRGIIIQHRRTLILRLMSNLFIMRKWVVRHRRQPHLLWALTFRLRL